MEFFVQEHPRIFGLLLVIIGFPATVAAFALSLDTMGRAALLMAGLLGILLGSLILGLSGTEGA